jgi:hypothetical protein
MEQLRVEATVPPFRASQEFVTAFLDFFKATREKLKSDCNIASISVEAAGVKWRFTPEEFLESRQNLEDIDIIIIIFSGPRFEVRGTVYLSSSIASFEFDGPEKIAVAMKPAFETFFNEQYRAAITQHDMKAERKKTMRMDETLPIPACELAANDLRDLVASLMAPEEGSEGLLLRNVRLSASSGNVTLSEESLDRLLEDPTLPSEFDTFGISTYRGPPEAQVRLSRSNKSTVTLSGPPLWVSSKKKRLERFFESHSNPDVLAQHQWLLALLCIAAFVSAGIIMAVVVRKFISSVSLEQALFGFVFSAGLLALFIYGYLSEKIVTRVWIGRSRRPASAARAALVALGGISIGEMLSILTAAFLGWLGG